MNRARGIRLAIPLVLVAAASVASAKRVCNEKNNWNEAWKRSCLDTQAQHVLENASSMTVMSLDPTLRSPNFFARLSESLSYRHSLGWRLLGQTTVKDAATRKRVAASIEGAVRNFNGWRATCFNPRHAVRVTNGSQTYDFIICYECGSLECYSGERQVGRSVSISGSSHMLDALLTAAHIKLAKS
jgi:hypothetical protein